MSSFKIISACKNDNVIGRFFKASQYHALTFEPSENNPFCWNWTKIEIKTTIDDLFFPIKFDPPRQIFMSAKMNGEMVLITHTRKSDKWEGHACRIEFSDGYYEDGCDPAVIDEVIETFTSLSRARMCVFGRNVETKPRWMKFEEERQKIVQERKRLENLALDERMKAAGERSRVANENREKKEKSKTAEE